VTRWTQHQGHRAAPADRLIAQEFSSAGDGTGTANLAGDWNATPTEFYVQAPEGEIYHIHDVMIFLDDDANFAAAKWGGGTALANGFHIDIHDDSDAFVKRLTPTAIKRNACIGRVWHDLSYVDFGTGDNFLLAAWHTASDFGSPIKLLPGWRITAHLTDDASHLIEWRITVQGHAIDAP
jgi:hypothetical protein